MAYAAPSDMITRFGAAEMIRLTTPQDQDMTTVNAAPILLALGDATDVINSYISKRYLVPLATVPNAVSRAACLLARFDLCTGDGREPPEQVRLSRKETIAWLEGIAAGRVILPLQEAAGDDSFAIMSDRGAVFGPGCDVNVYPGLGNYMQSDPGGDVGDGAPIIPLPGADLGDGWDADT